MSISSRITEMEQHIGNAYDKIEDLGIDLTDVDKNIDNISSMLENVWNEYPKVTASDVEEATLNGTKKGRMEIDLKGQTEQDTLTGKNLFNESKMNSYTMNGITWEYSNEKIKLSGQATSAYSQTNNLRINLPAGTYIFSKIGNSNLTYNAWFYKAGGTLIANTKLNNPFTISEEAVAIVLYVEGITSGTSYNENINIQVEAGSTATSYEPFCGGTASPNPEYPQVIKNVEGNANVKIQNKNIANIETSGDKTIGGVPFTVVDGVININGTTQNSIANYYFDSFQTNSGNAMLWLEITGYTDKESANASIILQQSSDNSTWSTLKEINFRTISTKQYSLILDNTKYYRFRMFTNNNTFTNATIKIQLEYGTEKTSWIAHQEQNLPFTLAEGQKLMQGGSLQDDGIHNVRGQIVLDGRENWELWVNNPDRTIITFFVSNKITNAKNDNVLSNYFVDKKYGGVLTEQGIGLNTSNGNLAISILKTELDTLDVTGFKSWLSTHNTLVEYELQEEVITPYTETQQSQYNTIKQARSYDDITYITSTSDELGFNMDVESLPNANKVIDSLDTRLLALESEV